MGLICRLPEFDCTCCNVPFLPLLHFLHFFFSASFFLLLLLLSRIRDPVKTVGDEEVCVSKIGLIIALVITALLALVAVAIAVSCWLMAYRRRPKTDGPLPHPPEFPNPLFTTPEPLAEPTPDYLN